MRVSVFYDVSVKITGRPYRPYALCTMPAYALSRSLKNDSGAIAYIEASVSSPLEALAGCDMSKLDVLKKISFGQRVAEDEVAELARYFVETDQWTRILGGEVDIIRGEKGAGKSAIYSLLIMKTDDLFDRKTLLVPGEKPRGTPVFSSIISNPPINETEFVALWKLYILAIIAQKMRDFGISDTNATKVYKTLETARLMEREYDLSGILRAVQDLAKKIFHSESIEAGVQFEPNSGIPTGFTGKISFREPNDKMRDAGVQSVDTLLRLANSSLEASGYKVWVLLDRLDVAFAETHDLERNALRALFRAYRDIADLDYIEIKIFLRSDIWKRITEDGFREASHITRFVEIEWNTASLLNLVMKRLLSNTVIIETFGVDKEKILSDFNLQLDLFYRVYPSQVDQGSNKPSSFDWMTSRCADATSKTAPRELIHLLTSLRETEIRRLERGEPPAGGEQLFERATFKQALPSVSETRLNQTLFAEYPDMRKDILRLDGEKTEQSIETLGKIWEKSTADSEALAQKLVRVGFFQPRGSRDKPTFWVPFLYRDALNMSQGMAEESRSPTHSVSVN